VQPPILIVSDPPHQEVDLDAAAAILGLDVYQTRLKLVFAGPEVLASSDGDYATGIAESYTRAGVRVAAMDGRDLAALPWPEPVASFEFTGKGLIAHMQNREVELTYASSVVGVYCKPPSDFQVEATEKTMEPGSSGPDIAEAIEWMANLDLYFVQDGALQRISIVQDLTDFSGLGRRRQGTAAEDMAETVAGITRRFTRMHLDSRLENVRPRRRFRGGDAEFNPDTRQRFSFGTLLLRGILTSIAPELGDLTQYELGSRLGYLTSLGRTSFPLLSHP